MSHNFTSCVKQNIYSVAQSLISNVSCSL